MSTHRERYFTERLFYMPDTDALLHVYFVHGRGWFAQETSFMTFSRFRHTYTEVMQLYNNRNPELLLQEEP